MKKLFVLSLLLIMTFVFSGLVQAGGFDFDLEGRTVTFVDARDLSMDFEEGADLAHLEAIEDQFNVNIEFRQMIWHQIIDEFAPSIMAGDPIGDVVAITTRNLWGGTLEQGVLLPLNDALAEINYFDRLPEINRDFIKQSGSHPGGLQFGFSSTAFSGSPMGIVWNKDFFAREGLPDLYELQDAGEWTWDVFAEILEESYLEGNQWGFATFGDSINHIYWLTANDVELLDYDEDLMPVVNINTPEALTTYEFLNEPMQNEYIYTGTDRDDKFWDGAIAMKEKNFNHYRNRPEDLDDEYGFVLYPKGPDAEDYSAAGRAMERNFYIPITEEEPEALIELTGALWELIEPYTDGEEFAEEVIDDFAMMAADIGSINTYEYMMHNRISPQYHFIELNNALENAYAGEVSIAAAIDEGLPSIESRLGGIYEVYRETYGGFIE